MRNYISVTFQVGRPGFSSELFSSKIWGLPRCKNLATDVTLVHYIQRIDYHKLGQLLDGLVARCIDGLVDR